MKKDKVVLFGAGKLGKNILRAYKGFSDKVEIIAIVDPVIDAPIEGFETIPVFNSIHNTTVLNDSLKGFNDGEIPKALIVVPPKELVTLAKQVSMFKMPTVIGTTGWYDDLKMVKSYFSPDDIPFEYFANFSEKTRAFIADCGDFVLRNESWAKEFFIKEYHHTRKVDAPSGTAIMMAKDIIEKSEKFKFWVSYIAEEDHNGNIISVSSNKIQKGFERADQKYALDIFSIRKGNIVGTHRLTAVDGLVSGEDGRSFIEDVNEDGIVFGEGAWKEIIKIS